MTLVEKLGKAHKHMEADKTKERQQTGKKPLPGPPGSEQPGTDSAAAESADPAKEGAKQHERRGENATLKELVEYLRTLHDTEVLQPASRFVSSF